jgi:hypothetical protein
MKSPSARRKRTPPERSGPVRNLLAPPQRSAPEPAAACDPIAATGAAVCGALENGVRSAYAVIDEYMRRGQDTARTIFNDPTRRGAMNDANGNGAFNAMNPLAIFTEQWMTAMRPWAQAWSAFLPNMMQQPGANPFAGSAPVAPTVSVKVSSTRPIEVTANFYPGLDLAGLISDPLLADAAAAAPIEAPEIIRDPTGVRISVKVADKQPAGLYRGAIRRRADGTQTGDLTVIVT